MAGSWPPEEEGHADAALTARLSKPRIQNDQGGGMKTTDTLPVTGYD